MPSKYQEYRQMADTAERQLTSSYKSWTQFLRTAARLYKYPYNEQVMIHAQRPDATACAEYDFWNKKDGALCPARLHRHCPYRHKRPETAAAIRL